MQYKQAIAHIKELKEAQHITSHALDEKCNVTDGTMSKMLNGQAAIPLHVAIDLAQALGVSLSELVGEPWQTRAETVSVRSSESARRAGIVALLVAALTERLR